MNFYFFDHKNPDGHQGESLSDFDDFAKLFGATRIASKDEVLDAPYLCFCHAGDKTEQTQDDFEEIVDAANKQYVMLVSSFPSDLISSTEGVYCLKYDLDRVVEFLNVNSENIRQFKLSCEQKNPRWDLLCPDEFKEILVAAYWLRIVEEQGITIDDPDLGEAFWNNVSNQYHEVKGISDKPARPGEEITKDEIASVFSCVA